MDSSTRIAEMLSDQIQQELAPGHTFADFEQKARQLLQEVGQRAIALAAEEEEQRYPATEIGCPNCGQAMPYVRRRSTQLRTLFGNTTIKRAYYLCSACHRGHYPLDERLGLRPNAISAELERLVAMTGSLLPFEKGRDLFEALTLVSLSDQTMDKATRAYGSAAMEREQTWRAVAYDREELQRRKRAKTGGTQASSLVRGHGCHQGSYPRC